MRKWDARWKCYSITRTLSLVPDPPETPETPSVRRLRRPVSGRDCGVWQRLSFRLAAPEEVREGVGGGVAAEVGDRVAVAGRVLEELLGFRAADLLDGLERGLARCGAESDLGHAARAGE